MLWNWNTIDSCFLASSWHIRSRSMFAGSCIGVICLVLALEFLRRTAREYDAFIIHRAQLKSQYLSPLTTAQSPPRCARVSTPVRIRPTLIEQFVRAFLHMLQFAVAYIVMLLAMYFNGYIIICIFIGAFLGSFIFSWENDATAVTKCCG
ncbi:Ctr copper transporter [Aspergillus crustosus]